MVAKELKEQINKVLGDDAVILGSELPAVTHWSTGIFPVDAIMDGGLPVGRFVEIYGDYCVAPETPVLTDALTWVPAGDLELGYGLIGFDEQVNQGRGRSARMKPSEVELLGNKKLQGVRIVTDRGEVTCSIGHGFVAMHRSQGTREWRRAGDLQVGDTILHTTEPWNTDTSRDAGYIAGIFDGEGWIDKHRIHYAQNPGVVLDESLAALKRLGFDASVRQQSHDTNVMRVSVTGGRWETLRVIGQLKSHRFTSRAFDIWNGAGLIAKGPSMEAGSGKATVLAVEYQGDIDVVTMQTSSRTFMAGGFPSHNSTLKSYIAYRSIASVQAKGGSAALVDTEKSFDKDWASKLGVNTDDVVIQRPQTGEDAIALMELLVRNGHDLIVWDSIAATQPKQYAEKKPGEDLQPGGQARMMSAGLRRINAGNTRSSILALNQTRVNVGMTYGSTKDSMPGGKAMPFYASYRLRLVKAGQESDDGKVWDGEKLIPAKIKVKQKIKVQLEKWKLSAPVREVWMNFDLRNGSVDEVGWMIGWCIEQGYVQMGGGGYYEMGDVKVRGREKFFQAIADDEEMVEWMKEEISQTWLQTSRGE